MKRLLTYLILLIVAAGCENNDAVNLKINLSLDSLKTANTLIIMERDSIQELNNLLSRELKSNIWLDEDYFNDKGITNPTELVYEALSQKPELIPLKAVLGGNMSLGRVQLLSSKWLIAEYDDGHVMGKSLYEYDIKDDGTVTFKLLRSAEDE